MALTEISLPSDTETEICNSVNAGMVVTAHEQQINFNGWIGEGYIIIDPATGAGAYKIAGGGNGGFLDALGIYGKTLSLYLTFKGLLRIISGVAGSWLAPIAGLISGIAAVSTGCENTEAAMLFNGILVAMALIQIVLAATLVFGPMAYIVFAVIIFILKTIMVELMLGSPLCRRRQLEVKML